MGLLDKASTTQGSNNTPGEKGCDGNNSLGEYDSLILRIKEQKTSLDYGTQIYRIISQYLSIKKGILFYKADDHENYTCLCSNGYDITTNNRLRIDSGFFDEREIRNNLSLRKPFKLGASLPYLKNFFSTREFGMIEEMYLIPVFENTVLISIIIITEWNDYEPENWVDLFQIISNEIAKPLRKSRMALVDKESEYEQSAKIDHEILLKERLSSVKDKLILIKLNLSSLLKNLLEDGNGLSALNIKKEVISVFRTMSGSDVEIIELQGNNILMIQKKERIPDKDLYLYQLSASLPLLYTDLKDSPDLESEVFEIDEATNPEVVIKDLL